MKLESNILFHDRYRLKKQLGRGGFSEVWLADDTRAGDMPVALKVYAPGVGLDEDGVKLFTQEFTLLFNVNHGNLLKPTHYDIFLQMPYLIMPFCPQGSAARLSGRVTEQEAWQLLHDVASGLAYMHSLPQPLIHQDIKPDNILAAVDGRFLITDFGISTKVRSTLRKSIAQTPTSGGGTLAYMGPERFGKEPVPIKASDVWALGATVYELMTGDVPFGENGGLIQKSGAEIPVIQGHWSADLKKVIMLCISKETWDRPTAERIAVWSKQKLDGQSITWKAGKVGVGKNKHARIIGILAGAIAAVAAVWLFAGVFASETKRPNEVTDEYFNIDSKSFVYTGQVENNLPQGRGVAIYDKKSDESGKSGDEYTGGFVDGRRHGHGVVRNNGRLVYDGQFFQNKMHGYGKYYFESGERYEGEFSNGMFNGKGAVYNPAGEIIQQGMYLNDEFVK